MKQTFPVNMEGLAKCGEFLASFCAEPRPSIILDEIVSNIVRCSNATEFSLEYSADEASNDIIMIFRDNGIAFDPTKTKDPDVTAKASERAIGGLGLYMVRKMSKLIEYRRDGDENELRIVVSMAKEF